VVTAPANSTSETRKNCSLNNNIIIESSPNQIFARNFAMDLDSVIKVYEEQSDAAKVGSLLKLRKRQTGY